MTISLCRTCIRSLSESSRNRLICFAHMREVGQDARRGKRNVWWVSEIRLAASRWTGYHQCFVLLSAWFFSTPDLTLLSFYFHFAWYQMWCRCRGSDFFRLLCKNNCSGREWKASFRQSFGRISQPPNRLKLVYGCNKLEVKPIVKRQSRLIDLVERTLLFPLMEHILDCQLRNF